MQNTTKSLFKFLLTLLNDKPDDGSLGEFLQSIV